MVSVRNLFSGLQIGKLNTKCTAVQLMSAAAFHVNAITSTTSLNAEVLATILHDSFEIFNNNV